MIKPTIALDIDEVLASFLPAINDWHNKKFGTNHKTSDYKTYLFGEVWGVEYDDSVDIVYAFFESEAFRNIKTVPGAKEAVAWLAEHFDLVVVTSRQKLIEAATLKWLAQHFGAGTFSKVLFGNIWIPRRTPTDPGGDEIHGDANAEGEPEKRSKREMCQEIHAKCLVDDQIKYIHDVKETVELPILFNFKKTYRWLDKEPTHHELVASDWADVLQLIRGHFRMDNDAKFLEVVEKIQLVTSSEEDS